MKKLSAYQKLKQENERLKGDIRTLVLKPESMGAKIIQNSIMSEGLLAKALFSGDMCEVVKDGIKFKGILSAI